MQEIKRIHFYILLKKILKSMGAKCLKQIKKAIEDSSANLRNALKGTDIEEVKKKTQDLVQEFNEIRRSNL